MEPLVFVSTVSDKGRKFSTLGGCFSNGEMVVPFAEAPLDDLIGLLSQLSLRMRNRGLFVQGEVLQRAVY